MSLLKFNGLLTAGRCIKRSIIEAVTQPLHKKKGDPNIPDNYRGISLLNICCKLYSYIINKRLTQWIEENSIISESQAGFRKRYSTSDQLFTLVALIQKQLCNHRKLYVAFIDFRKLILWSVPNCGTFYENVKGKMYQAIVCMYKAVKAEVRSGVISLIPSCAPAAWSKGIYAAQFCFLCSLMN